MGSQVPTDDHMAGSGGGALRCRPGGLEEGLKTCFECDDRLIDTTQTGRERSRNISRSLQGHNCGRNAGYPAPPAQIRTCGFPAYGSYLGCLA